MRAVVDGERAHGDREHRLQDRPAGLGASSSFLHVLLVVILVLMIWKPGA
jgi:hypothetical protein